MEVFGKLYSVSYNKERFTQYYEMAVCPKFCYNHSIKYQNR